MGNANTYIPNEKTKIEKKANVKTSLPFRWRKRCPFQSTESELSQLFQDVTSFAPPNTFLRVREKKAFYSYRMSFSSSSPSAVGFVEISTLGVFLRCFLNRPPIFSIIHTHTHTLPCSMPLLFCSGCLFSLMSSNSLSIRMEKVSMLCLTQCETLFSYHFISFFI